MKEFRLPDLGEGLQEAEIVAWHVVEGDHVVEGQPLVSVETEKAVVEIPSPQSGHIDRLHGLPGDVFEVGAVLVEFETAAHPDTGTVVGELPTGTGAEAVSPREPSPSLDKPEPDRVKAAPAVRAMASRRGIDLSKIVPSGPAGEIRLTDLDRVSSPANAGGFGERLSAVRRAMARNMARAHAEVVPATVSDIAVVDHLTPDTDVTVRLIRAVARGCATAPALNAWFDAESKTRKLHDTVDIGIAVDTEDGLFAPVLRDVGNRDAADLRRGLDAMKTAIVARTVPATELRNQTITLSNFGTLGGRYAALVVVPPQVAILGAGRIAPSVVASDGTAVVRRTLPLSLTFDHRAVTGGEAARFLAAVIADLGTPA